MAAAAVTLLVALAPVVTALAHGDEPRLDVDPQRLAPGAALTIHGYDFAYDSTVALALVGEQERRLLGSVQADEEGSFVHTAVLPPDLAAGDYTVEASSDEHVVSGSPITVAGMPLTPGNENTRREEGDTLLAPMPTPAPAAAPDVHQLPAESATRAGASATSLWVAVAACAVVAGLALIVAGRRRARVV